MPTSLTFQAKLGWALFVVGSTCLVYVAAKKTGLDGAIGAIGTSLLTAAAVLGVQARTGGTSGPGRS